MFWNWYNMVLSLEIYVTSTSFYVFGTVDEIWLELFLIWFFIILSLVLVYKIYIFRNYTKNIIKYKKLKKNS